MTQVVTNQLYRYAQNRAVSQWRHWHPLAYKAYVHVSSYLCRKGGIETTNFIRAEDCAAVVRAVDEVVARRGGQDALIRHLTKLTWARYHSP